MILIPARLGSTRIEKKMLKEIGALPLIIHTAMKAREASHEASKETGIENTYYVATDSREIESVCKEHDINVVLTGEHDSGTDRCAEAARILGLKDDDLVINLQGDEPLIEKEVLKAFIKNKDKLANAFMMSCFKLGSRSDASSHNSVKVVLNDADYALYFSRSLIPYPRNPSYEEKYKIHLGVYGFLNKGLQEFCALPKTNMEFLESLEQLRALGNSKSIYMFRVESKSIGVDTNEDLELARQIFINL